ncbi:MAG: AAA family ATPase [Desulfosalsimonas sp.]
MAGAEEKILTITVGLPGCGKTWWARQAGFDRAVCLDDWREKLWGNRNIQDGPGGTDLLIALHNLEIREALKNGENVVVHNTNILKKHRRPLVEMAREAGYQVRIVYFEVPLEVCRQRNRDRSEPVPEAVLDDFARRMEPPEADEADCVIRYSNLV